MENTAKKFISWRRVSTKKQGKSGLGLSAQKDIIDYFVKAENGVLIADYEEVYTGKDLEGCTQLRNAMEHCKREDAILIIAKTDRFRNTIEALQVYEQMNGKIYFCDLPHSDKFTLTLFFSLAEREALMVSIRTKAALKVLKEKGVKLGAPTNDNIQKAQVMAHKAKVENAKANDNNRFIQTYVEDFERHHSIYLKRGVDTKHFENLARELNRYVKTQTGKEWTKKRVYEIVKKIKLRNGFDW